MRGKQLFVFAGETNMARQVKLVSAGSLRKGEFLRKGEAKAGCRVPTVQS